MTSFGTPGEMWVRRIFFLLAFLYILPFWIVEYIPTVDGPCHTYNAWILRQYGNTEDFPLFQRYFEINARPYPNWVSHGAMALLMHAVPPLIAEKILVSGYVLTFLFGVWYLVGSVWREQRWLAFLAFPFPYNHLFQFGFYNFSISLALFPWILGLWWRNRADPSLAFALKINLLLWLCWFSHVVSFVVAIISIAVLWLATLRRDDWRRHPRHILLLAPQILLPIWYFSDRGPTAWPPNWSFDVALDYLRYLEVLITFSENQQPYARGLAVVFGLLLSLTLWRENIRRRSFQDRDAFLLLTAVVLLLYFAIPNDLAGGSFLKNRLSLYPWLLLIPWLSPRLGRTAQTAGVAVLASLAALNLGYQIRWYDRLDGEIGGFLAGLELVQPDTRVLPLLFEHRGPTSRLLLFGHVTSYAALEKGLVDWDNYEAAAEFFPTRFRPEARPSIWHIEAEPAELYLQPWKRRADYVYTWGLPPGAPLERRLQKYFVKISDKNGGVLWENRLRVRQEARR
ncbi:MAG TPA: hypothetical protein VF789_12395 [Thermoanaerobaculia bacterium]